MESASNINLQVALQNSIQLVIKIGSYINTAGQNFKKSMIEQKGFNDLVSEVDRNAEKLLVTGLQAIVPGAGFITEEETFKDEDKPVRWIIDPLDGTTNFVHGLPIYSISVALEADKEVIMGIVFDVTRNDCFYAVKGNGCFLNGNPVKVSDTESMSGSLLATGFPYSHFEKMPQYLNILQDLMKSSHGLRRMGSAAIDLAYVACGRFEGFFEYNLNPWDVAAGSLLVKEAGGTVTDFSGGDDAVYGREIVAAGPVHEPLKSTIMQHWNS